MIASVTRHAVPCPWQAFLWLVDASCDLLLKNSVLSNFNRHFETTVAAATVVLAPAAAAPGSNSKHAADYGRPDQRLDVPSSRHVGSLKST
jgi:hypothetical protein